MHIYAFSPRQNGNIYTDYLQKCLNRRAVLDKMGSKNIP